MAEEKKIVRKKIQAADRMNKIMADYFYELNDAAVTGKRKVAWCTSVGPAELLRALGVTSPKNINEVTDAHIDDVARQIEALVPTLEEISGSKLDMDRLRETVSLSRECTELWKQVLETAKAAPAPLTFFDGTIHMGPAVVLRGTREAIDYYKLLLSELTQRIRDGVGAVDGETVRMWWEGMPVWGRLRQHSEPVANLKATVLASPYCRRWIFPAFDGGDQIRTMAKGYLELLIVRSD